MCSCDPKDLSGLSSEKKSQVNANLEATQRIRSYVWRRAKNVQ